MNGGGAGFSHRDSGPAPLCGEMRGDKGDQWLTSTPAVRCVQAGTLLWLVTLMSAPAALGAPKEHMANQAPSASSLIEALINDNATLALELLDARADPAAVDVITPMYAAQEYLSNNRERRRMLRALLAAGAPVDQPTQDGSTTLMLAAYQGDVKSCDVLLDAGADPRRLNDAGYGSISAAHMGGNAELAEALREHADVASEAQREAWRQLLERVERHIDRVHAELQALCVAVCKGEAPDVPSPAEQARMEVKLPSCKALHAPAHIHARTHAHTHTRIYACIHTYRSTCPPARRCTSLDSRATMAT